MISLIESLANELLDLIVENLDVAGQVNLLQCNKFLRRRMESDLYNRKAIRDCAMRWACLNGNTDIIRLLVRYGASVDAFNHHDYSVPYSTLALAARGRQTNVFGLLLELGAKWTGREADPVHFKDDKKGFIQLLMRPSSEQLLRLYINAGFGCDLMQIKNHSIELVHRGASVELVRELFDRGLFQLFTPVKQVHQRIHFIPANNLSLAILRNSTPLFDLFLEKGADVNLERALHLGNSKLYLTYQPLHIPIFTAARVIPTHGLGWMHRCLDMGADINSCCVSTHFKWGKTNPLLFYIDSIKSWAPDKVIHPVDGLKFLLQHNATFPDTRESIVVHLLDKWGVNKLKYANFFDTLKFLIENGESSRFGTQILNYRQGPDYRRPVPTSSQGIGAWTSLVAILVELYNFEETDNPENESINTLLQDYILGWPCSHHGLDSFEEATVEGMIRAGASLNAVTHKMEKSTLQILCEPWHNIDASHLFTHEKIHECDKFEKKMRLVKFLVQKGGARTEAEVESLMTALKNPQVQDKEKLYLFCLIAALKGKKHLPKRLPGKYKSANSDKLSKPLSEISLQC